MKKSVLMFSLLSGTVLMFPWLTIASGFPAHTHTYTPEPKPAFQFEQPDKAYKTASVCFLGVGDCDPNVGFDKGDDYKIDTEAQCKNEGFSKQNCNSVQTIDGVCPYNSAYGLGCKCVSNLISCPAGRVGVGEKLRRNVRFLRMRPRSGCLFGQRERYQRRMRRKISILRLQAGISIYFFQLFLSAFGIPGTAAADNIPTAFVRPELTKGRTAAPNTGPTVPANAKLNTTTTAETGLRQTVLTAASPIGAIVLPSAKPVMLTIAGTERRLSGLVRVTPVVLITPTALPKSVPGPANPGINKKEAPAKKHKPPTGCPSASKNFTNAKQFGLPIRKMPFRHITTAVENTSRENVANPTASNAVICNAAQTQKKSPGVSFSGDF